MFHSRQFFKDTWMTLIESFQFIIIKIKNFNFAVSCTFGLSYNVVGLYLEILIAPINSVHMGILWTKFHKKTENCYFWQKNYETKGLGISQTQLKRVLWLLEGIFNKFFSNYLIYFYDCFLYVWHFVVCNLYLVTSKYNSCKMCL